MIYARIAAYLVAAALLFGSGWKVADWRDTAKLEALRTVDATNRANGEEVARTALASQLVAVQATASSNARAMIGLANENATVTADRDATVARVRRLEQLLATAAARPPAQSHTVPQTDGGLKSAGASGADGLTDVERLLVDAKSEAERNANRLDALIAEIRPQL